MIVCVQDAWLLTIEMLELKFSSLCFTLFFINPFSTHLVLLLLSPLYPSLLPLSLCSIYFSHLCPSLLPLFISVSLKALSHSFSLYPFLLAVCLCVLSKLQKWFTFTYNILLHSTQSRQDDLTNALLGLSLKLLLQQSCYRVLQCVTIPTRT